MFAVDFDNFTRRFVVTGKQRTGHDHAGTAGQRLGHVAMLHDAAIGNHRNADGCCTVTHGGNHRAMKTGLVLGDADPTTGNAGLDGIAAPAFQVAGGVGRGNIAANQEAARESVLDVLDHAFGLDAPGIGHVQGDVFRCQASGFQFCQLLQGVFVDTGTDGSKQALLLHGRGKAAGIHIEAVHGVEPAQSGKGFAGFLVHHRFHVGGVDGHVKTAWPELNRGIALLAAVDNGFSRDEVHVAIVQFGIHHASIPFRL